MAILNGQIINNRYRVDNFQEQVGAIKIYRVYDLDLNAVLTMKVIPKEVFPPPGSSRPQAQATQPLSGTGGAPSQSALFQYLKRECNQLIRLRHPNILPFYGLEQTPDEIYLFEEYIQAQTLKNIQFNQHGQPMSILEAMTFIKAICLALSHAHKNGVVHGGVKPSNVLVDQSGKIYVAGFGSAYITSKMLGMSVGTSAYSSPEQRNAEEPLTPAADIYPTGAILYELVTGKSFTGEPPSIPDPRQFNPAISDQLAAVILKSLAEDPRQRYGSIQAFLEEACRAANLPVENLPNQMSLVKSQPPPRLPIRNRMPVPPGGAHGSTFPNTPASIPELEAFPPPGRVPAAHKQEGATYPTRSTLPQWLLFILGSLVLYALALLTGMLLYRFILFR